MSTLKQNRDRQMDRQCQKGQRFRQTDGRMDDGWPLLL